MGNRAIITTKNAFENDGIGVYLHWNGGHDSVSAFLKYCELRGFRAPEQDNYGWARLCQVIGNFFGGDSSIGIGKLSELTDPKWCDNGGYLIENWKIVGRVEYDGEEQDEYDCEEMLEAIDDAQPEQDRLGAKFLRAPIVDVGNLKVGDEVFVRTFTGFEKHKIVGKGKGIVNGQDVTGVPFCMMYASKACPARININNYLREKEYRRVENV